MFDWLHKNQNGLILYMRAPTFLILVIYLFFSKDVFSAASNSADLQSAITPINLKMHVLQLSSDAMEGRLTGTLGEKRATEYIATIFNKLGLTPMGDNGTFFQEFPFVSSVSLGKNNILSLNYPQGMTKLLQLNKDWTPLDFGHFCLAA